MKSDAGVKEIMMDKKFGSAGNHMVIEEFMTGREVSVLSFVDGKTIKIMSSAQDHKRPKDGVISRKYLIFLTNNNLSLNQGPPDYENDKVIFCDGQFSQYLLCIKQLRI